MAPCQRTTVLVSCLVLVVCPLLCSSQVLPNNTQGRCPIAAYYGRCQGCDLTDTVAPYRVGCHLGDGVALTRVPYFRDAYELNLPTWELNLSNNSIRSLSTRAFFMSYTRTFGRGTVVNFTSIDISMNKLNYISPDAFQGLGHVLETLLLSENRLLNLQSRVFRELHSLARLDLSHNRILTADFLCQLGPPRSLDVNLEDNLVSALPYSCFNDSHPLLSDVGSSSLDVTYNYLSALPMNILADSVDEPARNRFASRLSIQSNPVLCECVNDWFTRAQSLCTGSSLSCPISSGSLFDLMLKVSLKYGLYGTQFYGEVLAYDGAGEILGPFDFTLLDYGEEEATQTMPAQVLNVTSLNLTNGANHTELPVLSPTGFYAVCAEPAASIAGDAVFSKLCQMVNLDVMEDAGQIRLVPVSASDKLAPAAGSIVAALWALVLVVRHCVWP